MVQKRSPDHPADRSRLNLHSAICGLARNTLRVHLSFMELQARRLVSVILLFNAAWLPSAVLAEPPERVAQSQEAESQQQLAEQLRKAREADRQREARREERLRENEAAKTVRTSGPPKESPDDQRARVEREAAARREVRAADRLRDRERAAARRERVRRSAER